MANTYTLLKSFTGDGISSSITISGIPTDYYHLIIKGSGKDTSTSVGSVAFGIQYNGDTAANYLYRLTYLDNVTQYTQNNTASNSIRCGYISTSKTSGANVAGPMEITIPDYQGVGGKIMYSTSSGETPDYVGAYTNVYSGGRWTGTAPVTSFTLVTSGTAWSTASKFSLYGLKLTA